MITTTELKVVAVPDCARRIGNKPIELVKFWQEFVAPAPWFDPREEIVVVVPVFNQLKICAVALIAFGTVKEAQTSLIKTMIPALRGMVRGFILMNNHSVPRYPSGFSITRKIKGAAERVDLEFLDHIVIGASRYCSAYLKKWKGWSGPKPLPRTYNMERLCPIILNPMDAPKTPQDAPGRVAPRQTVRRRRNAAPTGNCKGMQRHRIAGRTRVLDRTAA